MRHLLVAMLALACGTPPGNTCGDGMIGAGEDCDGSQLGGKTCADFGFNSGTLTCHPACVYDLRTCATVEYCDNGVDDDGDGDKDCDDSDCADSPACEVCGDGVITGDEECEDGNVDAGDCCDATCHAETGCEAEPNDDDAHAMPFAEEVRGYIRPADDVDELEIDVPEGMTGQLHAEVTGGAFESTCFTDLDSRLELWARGALYGSDDDGGEGYCSLLDVAGIPAGPAFLRLSRSSFSDVGFDYRMTISLVLSPCGDGLLQPGQECDDGNRTAGDGCDPDCLLEPVPESEPNNSPEEADGPFQVPFAVKGANLESVFELDSYAFDLDSWAEIRIETFGAEGPPTCDGTDTFMVFYAGVTGGAEFIDSDDNSGVDRCSLLPNANAPLPALGPGRYYVALIADDAAHAGPYTLHVTYTSRCGDGVISGGEECDGGAGCTQRCLIDRCGDGVIDRGESCDDGNRDAGDGCDASCQVEPGCGDGVLEAGEQCDDGGRLPGDCCDAHCQAEPGCEAEPNGEPASANGPLSPPASIRGTTYPSFDIDVYRVDVPAAADLRAETFDATGSGCEGLMTRLGLVNDNGEEVTFDFDSGVEACSLVRRRVPAGTWYLQIEQFTLTPTPPPVYQLVVSFESLCGDGVVEGSEACEGGPRCVDCQIAAVCGDGIVDPPEECDDGNLAAGDGCSPTCTREPICGDGVVEGSEECDDGNLAAGDGCSATCTREPRCGDGVVDAGEACDDGNLATGDGCSPACTAESGHYFEEEPNDDGQTAVATDDFSSAAADGTFSPPMVIHAAISPAGDDDVFAIINPGPLPASIVLETSGEDGQCQGIDTQLRLRDASGLLIAFDDDSGVGLCSLLQTTLAPGAIVYAQVVDWGDNSTIAAYRLSIRTAD